MVCYWTYSVKYFIFAEDKLHLGKAIQTSLMSLLSICIIFAEDKLHLGIVIQTSLMPLLSICIIFVELVLRIMNIFLNILWLIFGGIWMAIEYLISSVAMMLTIIGIPFGLQTLKIGLLSLYPFGKEVVSSSDSNGCLSLFMNILWLLLGGLVIFLSHLAWGVLLCITIVGIPFGMQHFKLAGLSLTPFGKEIIDK